MMTIETNLESQMKDRCNLLREMGFTGHLQLWCHFIEADRGVLCSWTFFGEYGQEQRQLSAWSWEELSNKAKEVTGLDLETREALLAL